jgi:hypothetical protein
MFSHGDRRVTRQRGKSGLPALRLVLRGALEGVASLAQAMRLRCGSLLPGAPLMTIMADRTNVIPL